MISHYDDIDRTASLLRMRPGLFTESGTVLYVGAKDERFQYGQEFVDAGYTITVLEAYHENAEACRNMSFVNDVIECDVREFESDRKWDVVFWWHGPEHVEAHEIKPTVERLEWCANWAVILGSPWGRYAQGAVGGNTFEIHATAVMPGMLHDLGFQVETLGKVDVPSSNITAVKGMCSVRQD